MLAEVDRKWRNDTTNLVQNADATWTLTSKDLTAYQFDAAGRLTSQTMYGGTTGFAYDSASKLTTETFSSGAMRILGHDPKSQQTSSIETNSSGAISELMTFTYDVVANRTSVVDVEGSLSTYTYDANRRLIQDATTGPNAHLYHYSYDFTGNRLTCDETGILTTYAYDVAQRLVTSVAGSSTTTFTYDVNGNEILVANGTQLTTMTYNLENRMSVHMDGSSVATYAYAEGGVGFMRSQRVDGVITTFIWDGSTRIGAKT